MGIIIKVTTSENTTPMKQETEGDMYAFNYGNDWYAYHHNYSYPYSTQLYKVVNGEIVFIKEFDNRESDFSIEINSIQMIRAGVIIFYCGYRNNANKKVYDFAEYNIDTDTIKFLNLSNNTIFMGCTSYVKDGKYYLNGRTYSVSSTGYGKILYTITYDVTSGAYNVERTTNFSALLMLQQIVSDYYFGYSKNNAIDTDDYKGVGTLNAPEYTLLDGVSTPFVGNATGSFTYKNYVLSYYDNKMYVFDTKTKKGYDVTLDVNINTYRVFQAVKVSNNHYFTIGRLSDDDTGDGSIINFYVYDDTDFLLELYQNSAEPNRLDKTNYLTSVGTLSGTLKDETSMVTPEIIIESSNVPNFNYAYIAKFNRYYFVTEITSVRNNLWRVKLSCDALMSYKNKIELLTPLVERQENEYDNLLFDPLVPIDSDNTYEYADVTPSESTDYRKLFDVSTTNAYRYILCTNTPVTGLNTPARIRKSFDCNTKYVLNYEQVSDFIKKLNNPGFLDALKNMFANAPMEGILSLKAYPFDFTDTFNINEQTIDDIIIGSYNTGSKGYIISDYADDNCDYSIARIDSPIDTDWKFYTNTISMYLPFYGFVDIDPSELIFGTYLVARYIINFDTGETTINIVRIKAGENGEYVIKTLSTNISIDIPISATNVADQMRLNSIAGITAGLSLMATAATGGAATPLVATTSVLGKSIQNNKIKVDRGGSVGGAWGGVWSPVTPYTITTKPSYREATNFASLVGRPCMKSITINSITGYTKVKEIHIEGLGSATLQEIKEVENVLKSGFIA